MNRFLRRKPRPDSVIPSSRQDVYDQTEAGVDAAIKSDFSKIDTSKKQPRQYEKHTPSN